jgi:hypothetical protein
MVDLTMEGFEWTGKWEGANFKSGPVRGSEVGHLTLKEALS